MDDRSARDDGDRLDPVRTAILGACTMVLATLFILMLLADNASALTF